jgi:hypothetical protein
MEIIFPVSIFPKKMQKIIYDLEEFLGFPKDYISTAIFLTAAASIGKTYKLKVRTSWIESTCLFICLVGRPGVNKSHPLTWAIKPLMDATEKNFNDSIKQNDSYTKEEMMDMKIPEPFVEQYVANNITPEAMVQIMVEFNIRFLIWSDELSGFLRNINKYNAGSDTEFLLSIFSNQTALINRKTQQKVMIKEAFACIGGTTQPEVLKSLFKQTDHNGLFDRFLFTNLDNVEKKKMIKEDLNPEVVSNYKAIINRLLSLELNDDGESNILCFTEEAQDAAFEWFNTNADRINEEPDDRICGIYTKLETYFFRFALIIHILRWSCNEANLNAIDIPSVNSAVELVEYFRHMNVKTLRLISPDPIESLTDLQRKVYDSLICREGEFSTQDGLSCAARAGMSERAFKYFLKRQDLFKRVKTGRYKKLF